MKALIFAGVVVVVALMAGSTTVSALVTIESVDPAGDAVFSPPAVSAPGYLDIVKNSLTADGSSFVVRFEMAASVPAMPDLHPGIHEVWWQSGFDTDPSAVPAGFPLPPGVASQRAEFQAVIRWDGHAFSGILIDRTPLFTGGDAVITPLSFTISGATLTATVSAERLGNPASFVLRFTIFAWRGTLGSLGLFGVDFGEPVVWSS